MGAGTPVAPLVTPVKTTKNGKEREGGKEGELNNRKDGWTLGERRW